MGWFAIGYLGVLASAIVALSLLSFEAQFKIECAKAGYEYVNGNCVKSK